MATVYSVLDSRDKNELNQTITNTKKELQGNIDTLETKHDNEVVELQEQVDTLEKNKATKAELSSHNTSNSAHNDIRLLIQNLTTRLNTLADSDDDTLDQMSEIVAYIEANRDLIESITTSKVSVSDIINNLTTNVSNKPLSAAMGVTLKALLDAIPDNTNTIVDEKIAEHNVDADAHEDIRTDVLNAQSTASGAQTAAENAQSAADAAQADADDALSRLNSLEVGSGKLDREVSTTDGIVTCEDALPDSGLIETRFYGKTVQNLIPHFKNSVSNGVTFTANTDGSFTLSGTSTGDYTVGQFSFYTVKPSTTYVFYVDKYVSSDSGIFVPTIAESYNGSWQSQYQVGKTTLVRIFTTSPELEHVDFAIVRSGTTGATVSGTYRVMLREATEAEIAAAASTPQTLPVYPDDSGPDASNDELGIMPLNDVSTLSDTFDDYWCPPGLSSIDNVEIVTAGKNILAASQDLGDTSGWANATLTDAGDEWIKAVNTHGGATGINYVGAKQTLLPGKYTISFDAYSNSQNVGLSYNYWMRTGGLTNIGLGEWGAIPPYITTSPSRYNFTFVVPSGIDTYGNLMLGLSDWYAGTEIYIRNVQLEYSAEASEYEPTQVVMTDIDLQGHSLCSLPDGTRDELRVDVNGSCIFSENVFEKILDGSENWIYKAIGASDDIDGYCNLMIDGAGHIDSIASYGNAKNILCNKLSAINPYSNNGPCIYAFEAFDGAGKYIGSELRIRVPNGGTVEQVKSWLSNNNTLILMNKMGPEIIYLGKIDLPRLPSSTSHVWINGTANTTNFALPINDLSVRYWLPNGELVADIYENGATDEMSDDEIIAIWNGATGNIVEASNADIEAIFD